MAASLQGCETIQEEKLDNWQFIAGGSFGDIYKARHRDWGIDVAVKKLNRNLPQGLDELLSEARKMGLASPITHVIRLYGMYESMNANGVCHGIVMEYLKHGSLAILLKRVQPVPWALKIRILHEVALGMNRLHDLSIPLLHLDLKPSNVLLDAELHVRIADFGLSRFKRGPSLTVGAEEYGGTLEYMPPEFLKVDVNYRPTQVFDVYSYGILMWAVLTGEEPYSAASADQIKLCIPQGDRPDMALLQDLGSVEGLEELKELMQCCWHQEPCRRPTFKECTVEMEKVFSAHKAEIIPAVRKVEDILINMVTTSREDRSTLEAYNVPSSVNSVASSASNMTQMVEEFQTLQFTDMPSQELRAVPVSATDVPSAQRPSATPQLATAVPPAQRPPATPQPATPQPATGPGAPEMYYGPHSLTSSWGPQQPWWMSGPQNPVYPPQGYSPYAAYPWLHGQCPPASYCADKQFLDPSLAPPGNPAPVIHISGKVSGIQIGHGNSMEINYGSKQHKVKKSKK